MIYKPTPKYIYDFMQSLYHGYLSSVSRILYIPYYLFTVYIPNDLDISTTESYNIIQKWLQITNYTTSFDLYNRLKMLKNKRYYVLHEEDPYTYDWFILLSICAENNLIIDSVFNDHSEATIYDIEPASERLKVRI